MSAMIELHNVDCMEYLATLEDNAFELAIVDPPYGIKGGINDNRKTVNPSKKNSMRNYGIIEWDNNTPNKEYFAELKRVSENQIIWGGNYFHLPPNRGFIIWDKMVYIPTMSQIEQAWVSQDRLPQLVKINNTDKHRIHVNQKPVKLYEWLLMNYAKEGDRILDTHLGSGSIAIACHNLGFDLVGCELDTDYFEAAQKRLEQHQSQLRIPMT